MSAVMCRSARPPAGEIAPDPPDLVLLVALDGACHVRRDGATTTIPAGHAALLTAYGGDPTDGSGRRAPALRVGRALVACAAPGLIEAGEMPIALDTPRRRMAARVLRAAVGDGAGDLSGGDLDDVALFVLRAFESTPAVASPALSREQGELLRRAELVIGERFCAELTIDDVARAVAVSPSYLRKLFRAAGTTFSTRLRTIRLDRAQRLLQARQRSRSSVTEVMLACGFQSPEHFSRAYRRRFGHPPSHELADAG